MHVGRKMYGVQRHTVGGPDLPNAARGPAWRVDHDGSQKKIVKSSKGV